MTNIVVMKNKTRSGRSRRPTRARLGNTGHAVGKYVEDAASLGARTLQGLNQLRRLINVETKVANTNAASSTFGTGGSVVCISQIAQGTDYTSRVGDSIRIQGVELRSRITMSATATNSLVRVVVCRDLDGAGTAPSYTDIFDAGLGATNALAQYNWLNRDRFSILYDEMFSLSLSSDQSLSIGWKAAHEGHVKYRGTTAASASDGKGSIYLVFVSDETVNQPTYQYNARLTFTDN